MDLVGRVDANVDRWMEKKNNNKKQQKTRCLLLHLHKARENWLFDSHPDFRQKKKGRMDLIFFIPGPSSEEVNHSNTRLQTLTITHVCAKRRKPCFNSLFITNNSFVILKSVIKICFQHTSNYLWKSFLLWNFYLVRFLGAGGDKNQIIFSGLTVARNEKKAKLGPVVQSAISLTSSFVVKLLTVLVGTISNSQVFLLKKYE